MRIGISSPVTIKEFLKYLDSDGQARAAPYEGLLAPSVNPIVHEFLQRGHEVVIFTLDKEVRRPIVVQGEKLKIYIGRYRKSARLRALTVFAAEIIALRGFIKKERLDVIHAHWTYEFAIASLAARCPIVCTVRDIAEEIFKIHHDAYRYVRLWMNRYVFARARRICFVANSPYTSQMLQRYHPGLSVFVLPNPVGIEMVPVLENKVKSHVIVSIASGWDARKNIMTLIEAFRIIRARYKDAVLRLIGPQFVPDHASVVQLPKEDVVGIEFYGKIAHDMLPAAMTEASVMVHPALEESFGNTLIEAMACGVPVVGGEKSGAVPWVLDDGRAGKLCDVTNPNAIAQCVSSLWCDETAWLEVQRCGYERVINKFSAYGVAEDTLRLYHDIGVCA